MHGAAAELFTGMGKELLVEQDRTTFGGVWGAGWTAAFMSYG